MADDLVCAFVATDGSGELLLSASKAGTEWSGALDVGQPTKEGVSMASLDGHLYATYAAHDGSGDLLLTESTDGLAWTPQPTLPQKSKARPALAVFEDKLSLAFVGYSSNDDTVYVCSGGDWSANHSTGHTSKLAPALASFAGKLWIAWIGSATGDDNIYVASSSDAKTWSGKTAIGQHSDVAPCLGVYDGKLWVGYIETGTAHSIAVCSSSDGSHWATKTSIGQESAETPSLVDFDSKLWCAFVATDGTRNVYVASSADGTHWSPDTRIGSPSSAAPALAVSSGITWVPATSVTSLSWGPEGTGPVNNGSFESSGMLKCEYQLTASIASDGSYTYSGYYQNNGDVAVVTAPPQAFAVSFAAYDLTGRGYGFSAAGDVPSAPQSGCEYTWDQKGKSAEIAHNWASIVAKGSGQGYLWHYADESVWYVLGDLIGDLASATESALEDVGKAVVWIAKNWSDGSDDGDGDGGDSDDAELRRPAAQAPAGSPGSTEGKATGPLSPARR